MDNSNLVEVTMKIANTFIFRTISEIRGKSKRPEFIILLKPFLMIVAYQMASFGKE